MERSDVGSWIGAPLPDDAQWRGQRLGLPASGTGAVAGTGQRVAALLVDWLTALLISRAIVGQPTSVLESFATMGIFATQVSVLTWLSGASFGQRILGLRVVGLAGRLGLAASLVRTLLVCLAIPPLVWDADGRGLHDRAVNSVVVRA